MPGARIEGILLAAVLALAACASSRKSAGDQQEQVSLAEPVLVAKAKRAAVAFFAERALQFQSAWAFEFESVAEVDGELVLKYRASHPDWFLITHDLVAVAYEPASGAIRLLRQ